MQRRSEAKHCSSLCSQSEGANFVATKQGLKIQQSHTPERWSCSLHIRGPHFASKVSYNAGAATSDCVDQRKSPLQGCCRRPFIFPIAHLCLSANAGAETNASGSRHERIWEQTQTRLGAETNASGSRDERTREQRRTHTGWRSPKGIGAEAEAMFFRLSALSPVSGHQRQLAACTEKRRCKTRMGCATPLFIKEHLFNAL